MHNDPELDRKFSALRRQQLEEWEALEEGMRPLREEQDALWASARAYLDAQYEPIRCGIKRVLAAWPWMPR